MRPRPLLLALAMLPLPLAAQQREESASLRPRLFVTGGAAGQRDDGDDLGSPGLTASFGGEWRAQRTVALRLEAQVVEYGSQAMPAMYGAVGTMERGGMLAFTGVWRIDDRVPFHVGAGGALVRGLVTNDEAFLSRAAIVGNVGVAITPRLALDSQFAGLTKPLGRTRGILTARLLWRL